MTLTQQREPSIGPTTLSKLMMGSLTLCDILEDTVREVEGQHVSEWKKAGITAIPVGTYKIIAEYSNRFGPDTLTLVNVPGYKYIRIHGGNDATHTEGCLLPGWRSDDHTILRSQAALTMLKAHILPLLAVRQAVYWEILPPKQ
jgi:hypothetical protein